MRARLHAFSLLELLVVAALVVVALSVAVPTGARVRELSKRSVCGVNLAGIGAAVKVYAASNSESWPIPGFRRALIDNGGVDYLAGGKVTEWEPGAVGYERWRESHSETEQFPFAGSIAVSTTRAYWMLVRSGDVSVKQFICPSNLDDVSDPTEQIDLYYDFTGYRHISYGYQVPFGPRDTQPREGADHRQIFAADKGPFYLYSYRVDPCKAGAGGYCPELGDPPSNWRALNSFNHGGQGNGEGQNTLFADGHTSFARIPAVGIDDDNIYTLMTDWWGPLPYNRSWGDTPYASAAENPYPGQDAFGVGAGRHSTTDSLIYP